MQQLSVNYSTELICKYQVACPALPCPALPYISHVDVTTPVLCYTMLSHRAVCQHCCHIHFVDIGPEICTAVCIIKLICGFK